MEQELFLYQRLDVASLDNLFGHNNLFLRLSFWTPANGHSHSAIRMIHSTIILKRDMIFILLLFILSPTWKSN